MIDLNDMLLFTKVVDAGSFTSAAQSIGMPKSTLSRRISNLETQLGIRLLQRTTRTLKLTELGAVFHERCKRVLAEAEEAERAVSQGQNDPQGLLRVSAPVETGISQLGFLVAEYMKLYPKIRVELDLSNRFVDLIEEGYDLAIRAGKLQDSTMIARRLATGHRVVCASPEYLERRGEPQHPDDLREHDMLLYTDTSKRMLYTFENKGSEASVTLNPVFSTNNHFTLRDAAVSSLGISIMPSVICQPQLEDGSLRVVLSDWSLKEDGVYAVYPSPRHLTPKVKSFVDFLVERFPK